MAGIAVRWEFEPDPMVHANAILRVDAGLRDRSMPLLAATQYVRQDIQNRFLTETDPGGTKWDDWKDSYRPRAERWGNPGILRLGQDIVVGGRQGGFRGASQLYKYVSDENNYTIDETAAYFIARGMPEWGWWHQEGRPDRTTARNDTSAMGAALAVFGVEMGGGGTANPLPKREFLGVSLAARFLIEQTFRDWFDKNIQLYYTSIGAVGRRHFIQGEGGRIISRSEAGLKPMLPRPQPQATAAGVKA